MYGRLGASAAAVVAGGSAVAGGIHYGWYAVGVVTLIAGGVALGRLLPRRKNSGSS